MVETAPKRVFSEEARFNEVSKVAIPGGKQQLSDSHKNLNDLAVYCEQAYTSAGSSVARQAVIDQTKQYTIQSLASVAYMVNSMATNVFELFNLQYRHLVSLESSISHLSQNIDIHRERVARRDIGSLSAVKANGFQDRIAIFDNPVECDYENAVFLTTALDEVGYGAPKAALDAAEAGRSRAQSYRGAPNTRSAMKQTLSSTSCYGGPDSVQFVPMPVFPGTMSTTYGEKEKESVSGSPVHVSGPVVPAEDLYAPVAPVARVAPSYMAPHMAPPSPMAPHMAPPSPMAPHMAPSSPMAPPSPMSPPPHMPHRPPMAPPDMAPRPPMSPTDMVVHPPMAPQDMAPPPPMVPPDMAAPPIPFHPVAPPSHRAPPPPMAPPDMAPPPPMAPPDMAPPPPMAPPDIAPTLMAPPDMAPPPMDYEDMAPSPMPRRSVAPPSPRAPPPPMAGGMAPLPPMAPPDMPPPPLMAPPDMPPPPGPPSSSYPSRPLRPAPDVPGEAIYDVADYNL